MMASTSEKVAKGTSSARELICMVLYTSLSCFSSRSTAIFFRLGT
jgi:hypothetical protein